jgi:aryl-alcohol dehydrogenase-like predicted oxidoreductase
MASVLGLGTWGFGGRFDIKGTALGWRELPKQQIVATLRAALDVGINFFDTSDFYGAGRAEELLREGLGAEAKSVIIATKGGLIPRFLKGTTQLSRDFSPVHIRDAVCHSLKRLNRDYIDLYQLHGPDLPLSQKDDVWATLSVLVAEGKIRFFGVSLGSKTLDLSAWGERGVATIQTRYNLLHPDEITVVERWRSANCCVIARSVFEHGLIFGKHFGLSQLPASDHRARKLLDVGEAANRLRRELSTATLSRQYSIPEIALLFPLGSSNVCIVLTGATSPAQVFQNSEAIIHEPMDHEDRQAIMRIAQHICEDPQEGRP